MQKFIILLNSFLLLLLVTACDTKKNKESAQQKEQQKKAELVEIPWQNLIVSNTFDGWHIYQNEDGTKSGWSVENNVFTFNSEDAQGEGDKSLITDKEYKSFEIKFDWKVSDSANSGFMWGVNDDEQYKHPYDTGPEIQILDPVYYAGNAEKQKNTAAALYDMIPPDTLVTRPAGEWNTYFIKINHNTNHGEVIHNEVQVLSFPLSGPAWDSLVQGSKFAEWDGFGKYKLGHLTLQDHPGNISYRNIKIKEIPDEEVTSDSEEKK